MQLLLVTFGLIILFSAAAAGLSAAPWLPTKPSQRRHLLEAFPFVYNQTVVDLGCGDGSLLFALARRYPNLKCVGYDISLLPLFFAWGRKLLLWRRYRNVQIRFGNLFKQPVGSADVIFIFLLNKCYPRLIEKFKTEIKPEAQVVVEAWPLPDLTPTQTLEGQNLLPIFIYSGASFRSQD